MKPFQSRPEMSETVFRQQVRLRYKIALYLFAACWLLTSLLMLFGAPSDINIIGKEGTFSYLTGMNEKKWIRIYTGSDFSASLLKAEIESAGFEVKLKSDKDAGLHAGFGSSGFAQVLVDAEDVDDTRELVAAFQEKMK